MAKKKSSRRKWILVIIAVLIVAAVAVVAGRRDKKGIEVTVRAVSRGDITAMVSATGRIQPESEVIITSEVPGEIIELPVRDGDAVQKGDLLVRVNPDTLEAQVKQQEAGLSSSRASAAQRRAEMLKTELDLRRIEDLFGKGFATQEELDGARTRLEVNRAAHEAAMHQVDRQEMQLKEARDQLAKASIFAPVSGTVTRLSSELGNRVVGTGQFAGTEIMRVADLSSMEVRVDVSEADIINVKLGQSATVEVDALPDTPFSGTVTQIANSAVTSGSRSQEELTTFEVRIRLNESAGRLRPGMTATADIATNTVTDVVKAPLGSVVVRPKREVEGRTGPDPEAEPENNDRPGLEDTRRAGPDRRRDTRVRVVFIADGDTARLRAVETGIADRDNIEITAGLEGGEEIITGSYSALTRELKDGSAITRRKLGEGGPGGGAGRPR